MLDPVMRARRRQVHVDRAAVLGIAALVLIVLAVVALSILTGGW